MEGGRGAVQKIIVWCRRRRTLLAGLAVVLTAALLAAWTGYDLAAAVDDTPVFTIVNDEYSQTVAIPEQGLTQTLPLAAGQRIYGVRLDFAAYDHAFHGGAVTAVLLQGDTELTQGVLPLVGLLDNTFAHIIFAAPYTAPRAQTLTLRLTFAAPDPADAGCPLGVWASEGQQGDMALAADAPLDATAALQYVTDWSGRWSRPLALALGLLTVLAVGLGFRLLFGGKDAGAGRLVAAVAAAALALGGAFSIVTPPLVGPDEYTHLAAAYAQASRLLGQPVADAGGHLLVRAADAPYFGTQTGDIGIFAYKTYLEHLGDAGVPAAADTVSAAVYQKVNPALYLGQTAGIALARALGRGFHAMLLLGRLGGLLLYAACAAAAVCIAPQRYKGLFAAVALLPMPLQMAASLSTDGTILGLVFSYTALCLLLRTQPGGAGGCAALVVLTAAVAPLKAIYLPVTLLCLLVPAGHLDPRRAPARPTVTVLGRAVRPGTLVKAGALLAAGALWCLTNLGALLYATRDVDNVGLTRGFFALLAAAAGLGLVYSRVRRSARGHRWFWAGVIAAAAVAVPVILWRITHMWGGLTPEQLADSIQPNGDSAYTYSVGYICRNVPGTVKLLLRSVTAQGAGWLQGVLGTALGEPIVYRIDVSWLLGVGLVLALVAAALPAAGQPPLLGRRACRGAAGIAALVAALMLAVALSWTPINYRTIFGVQGRYWLPVLPLALLPLTENRAVRAERDLARPAVFAVLCLTCLTLLQGCVLYAAWQPPV